MALNNNEADFKILVNGLDRTLPNNFRKQLNSYFDKQEEHEPSFYWNLLISSIRWSLQQYAEVSKNAEIRERADNLAQRLVRYSAENDVPAIAMKDIVQLWETEEFQSDFNAVWDPEVLRAKHWLKTFIPLASEVLNSKRDLTPDDVGDLSMSLTGIVEDQHSYGNSSVKAVLIGGRRNERKKWIHAFDAVSAMLLFVPADTFLVEQSTGYVDDRQSAFALYRDVSNSKFLTETPVILFISRINILEDAIKSGADIKKYLPSDYNGDIDARSIVLYFVEKFCEFRNPAKPFFAVCGDLVDKQAMKMIIPYILQTLILSENSTKKLSNAIVDPERNLFIYYPTKPLSTFATEIKSAISKSEPSILSSILTEAGSNLVETCKGLINNVLHADLKIQVGQSILHAHSLVLQARVPELLTLWTDNGATKDINVADLDLQSALLLLEFIYTDSIALVENGDSRVVECVLKLLRFADKFALQSFMHYLCRAMADKMHLSKGGRKSPTMDIQFVQELLQFGEAANSDYLQLKCTEYLLFLEDDNRPAKPTKQTKPKKRAGCIIS